MVAATPIVEPPAGKDTRSSNGARGLPPLTPLAQKRIDEIRTKLSEAGENEVLVRREVGKIVVDLLTNPDHKYGDLTLAELKRRLPYERDVLRPCRDLAVRFTDEEFQELMALRSRDGSNHLKWSHLVALVLVPTFAKAKQLAVQALNHDWGHRELRAKIHQLQGGPQSQGGRKHRPPRDAADLLRRASQAFSLLYRTIRYGWTGPDAPNYSAEVATMDPRTLREFIKSTESVKLLLHGDPASRGPDKEGLMQILTLFEFELMRLRAIAQKTLDTRTAKTATARPNAQRSEAEESSRLVGKS